MTIKTRTMLIENNGGTNNIHRICDFVILTTDLGKMIEPRQDRVPVLGETDMDNWDNTAEDHMINGILFDRTHNWAKMLSDGSNDSPPYMGGDLFPLLGR